mmetsp:Transcript_20529/g.63455  ORF Transcript_20529/g.63455 Transcript_20529/m.63455 type:complete len:337 (+) Transcript_20529:694-1704(+)
MGEMEKTHTSKHTKRHTRALKEKRGGDHNTDLGHFGGLAIRSGRNDLGGVALDRGEVRMGDGREEKVGDELLVVVFASHELGGGDVGLPDEVLLQQGGAREVPGHREQGEDEEHDPAPVVVEAVVLGGGDVVGRAEAASDLFVRGDAGDGVEVGDEPDGGKVEEAEAAGAHPESGEGDGEDVEGVGEQGDEQEESRGQRGRDGLEDFLGLELVEAREQVEVEAGEEDGEVVGPDAAERHGHDDVAVLFEGLGILEAVRVRGELAGHELEEEPEVRDEVFRAIKLDAGELGQVGHGVVVIRQSFESFAGVERRFVVGAVVFDLAQDVGSRGQGDLIR